MSLEATECVGGEAMECGGGGGVWERITVMYTSFLIVMCGCSVKLFLMAVLQNAVEESMCFDSHCAVLCCGGGGGGANLFMTFHHRFAPEAAIINYYHMDSTLSGHTDQSELDHTAPLVSVRYYDSACTSIVPLLKLTESP